MHNKTEYLCPNNNCRHYLEVNDEGIFICGACNFLIYCRKSKSLWTNILLSELGEIYECLDLSQYLKENGFSANMPLDNSQYPILKDLGASWQTPTGEYHVI